MEDERITVRGREFTIENQSSYGSTARVSISGSRIRIRIPRFMRKNDAIDVYNKFREWAVRKIEKMDPAELDPKPKFLEFLDGQEITVMGRGLVIRISEREGRSRTSIQGNAVRVFIPQGMDPEQKKRKVYLLVRRCIIRSMAESVNRRTNELNSFGFVFNGIRLRDQMTRWGSCSRRTRNISLNFRVLFAPEGIMDYVIVHELAHLNQPNHSEKFWSLVGSVIPDYKERKRWLHKNGNKLGVYEKAAMTPNESHSAYPFAGPVLKS